MAYDKGMANPALQAADIAGFKPPKKQLRLKSRAKTTIDLVAADPDAPVQWPTPIRYALDALTYKQRRFVILLASGVTKTQAYRMAYDVREDREDRSVLIEACTVSRNESIALALSILCEWLDKVWLLDAQEVIDWGLSNLYEESQNADKSSDRIAATVAIMKAHGAFVSRSEVRHIHTLDADSTKGIVAELAQLLGTPEPKTPKLIEQAAVESITFTDPDSSDS